MTLLNNLLALPHRVFPFLYTERKSTCRSSLLDKLFESKGIVSSIAQAQVCIPKVWQDIAPKKNTIIECGFKKMILIK